MQSKRIKVKSLILQPLFYKIVKETHSDFMKEVEILDKVVVIEETVRAFDPVKNLWLII